ncbi:MAG: hypothetical protein KF906_02545 [Actinobacteria bacterium]|nr:hypothetical protein [Actinomycetota bacterium]
MPAVVAVAVLVGCGVTARDATPSASAPTTTANDGVIAGLDAGEADPDCLAEAGLEDGIAWHEVLAPHDEDGVDEALTTVDDGLACIRVAGAEAILSDGFGEAFDAWYETDLDDAEVWCLLEDLAHERSPAFTLVDPLGNGRHEELLDAVERCADTSDVRAVHDTLIGPEHYGDEEMLDDLYDRCDTDDRACDLLYLWSGPGTDYHEQAASCGGRRPGTREYCADGLTLDVDGYVEPDAPGLDDLADRCRDGDGLSCDLLFGLIDESNPLAEVARTCGGRFPEGPNFGCLGRI